MILRALAGAAVALALGPASAQAVTYCVQSPGCSGTGQPTVQAALTAAENNPGLDQVVIGPGTFNSGGPGLSYTGFADPVQIRGAGRGRTILTAAANPGTRILSAADIAQVRDLSIRLPASSSMTGLSLDGGSLAERVDVTASPGTQAATGAIVSASTLRDSSIVLGTEPSLSGIGVRALGAEIQDVAVTSALGVWGTGNATLRNLRATASIIGVRANPSAGNETLSLERAQIRIVPSSAGSPTGIDVSTESGLSIIARLRHVTLSGPGTGTGVGAVANDNDPLTDARAAVNDTVVSGFTSDLRAARGPAAPGTALVTTDSSAYDPTKVATVNGGQFMTTFGDVDLRPTGPRWIDVGGNLRPRFNAPLVDRGNFAGLDAGESDRDLAGLPRIVDGDGDRTARRDIGAFEYQRARPLLSASGASGRVNQPLTFSARATDPDPGEVPAIRWRFDDGATASGPTVRHAFARPGRHTATVTATDPAGNPATRTVAVTVDAVAAPPTALALRIARRRVTMSRKGVASIRVTCSQAVARCAGTLTLRTRKGLRLRRGGPRRRVKLGAKRYAIARGRKRTVKVKLSRKARRLVVKRKRLAVVASTTARESGRSAKASARFGLRAPAKRKRR